MASDCAGAPSGHEGKEPIASRAAFRQRIYEAIDTNPEPTGLTLEEQLLKSAIHEVGPDHRAQVRLFRPSGPDDNAAADHES